MKNSKVVLKIYVNALMDQNRSYWKSSSWGLLRNEVVADHASRLFLYNLRSFNNVNSPFHARSEMALSATTSLNLSLDNQTSFVAERLRNFKGFFGGVGESAFLNVDIKLSHKLLGVVLVQVEVPFRCTDE